MKQMTVKDLFHDCVRLIGAGMGERKIVISDDNEANGYHGLFFGMSVITDTEDKKYLSEIITDSDTNNPEQLVVLG